MKAMAWFAALALSACAQAEQGARFDALSAPVERIERDTPGDLGVYVHRLHDDRTFAHAADRPWYLSSTVKVPVALVVLAQAQAGKLSLSQQVTLRQSDFVDGSGDLIWQKPGLRITVAKLIEKSLVSSDSTATDMLIRLVGEDALNAQLQQWVPDGFSRITTILQVRYDAYGELHPGVAELDNMAIVKLRNAPAGEARLAALVAALGVGREDLKLDSIDAAFARYYARGLNSATLTAIATLLEKLVAGELVDDRHRAIILGHMQKITTGEKRIKAGLPPGTPFAQKTGTQLDRACNVGVLYPDDPAKATVVAACLEDFGETAVAERALADLGRALGDAGVVE